MIVPAEAARTDCIGGKNHRPIVKPMTEVLDKIKQRAALAAARLHHFISTA